MRKATFLYLESELFHYDQTKQLLEDGLLTERQQKWIEEEVRAFDRLYNSVHKDIKLLIELRYFEKKPWQSVADALNISKISCYKLRSIFIQKLADKLGLI